MKNLRPPALRFVCRFFGAWAVLFGLPQQPTYGVENPVLQEVLGRQAIAAVELTEPELRELLKLLQGDSGPATDRGGALWVMMFHVRNQIAADGKCDSAAKIHDACERIVGCEREPQSLRGGCIALLFATGVRTDLQTDRWCNIVPTLNHEGQSAFVRYLALTNWTAEPKLRDSVKQAFRHGGNVDGDLETDVIEVCLGSVELGASNPDHIRDFLESLDDDPGSSPETLSRISNGIQILNWLAKELRDLPGYKHP